MIYTLTVSSQGQVIIPSQIRKSTGIKPGSKLHLSVTQTPIGPQIRLTPEVSDWTKRFAGSATGLYGDINKYISNERNSWDRN